MLSTLKNRVLEIESAQKVQEIMDAFDSNFESLAKHIKIVKGQIKIRRPEKEVILNADILPR